MTPARHLLTNTLLLLSLLTWTGSFIQVAAEETASSDSTQPRSESTKASPGEPTNNEPPRSSASKDGPATTTEEVKHEIQPKADAILQETSKFYSGLNSWKMHMEYLNRVSVKGSTSELVTEYDIAVQKPNKISVVLTKGRKGGNVVSDGVTENFYIPDSKAHMSTKAPSSLIAILMDRSFQFTTNGAFRLSLLDAMVSSDPYKSIREGLQELQYVGLEQLNGADAHHLKMGAERIYLDMWVDAGSKPWILKVSPDYTTISKIQPALALTVAADFKDFSTDPLPADTFAFVKPQDAKTVASIVPKPPELPAHPMLNTMAPPFELPGLDGKKRRLSDYRGKKIVILDWWATWCPPCVRSLPIVTGVYRDFASKGIGVEFLPINMEQDAAEVKEFLQERKLRLPTVLLDQDGKVSVTYKTQAIPQTLIVDKTGKIRVAKIGYDPDLKAMLTKDLLALLSPQERAKFAGGKPSGKSGAKPAAKPAAKPGAKPAAKPGVKPAPKTKA